MGQPHIHQRHKRDKVVATVTVGGHHTEREAINGVVGTGPGDVIGAGALEMGHGPVKSDVMGGSPQTVQVDKASKQPRWPFFMVHSWVGVQDAAEQRRSFGA